MLTFAKVLNAVINNDIVAIRKIFRKYTDENSLKIVMSNGDLCIIQYAVKKGYLNILEILTSIELPAAKAPIDVYYKMAINAVINGHLTVVAFLLNKKPQLFVDKDNYMILIYKAAKYNHREIVAYLYCINPETREVKDRRMQQVLSRLVRYGDLSMFKYVISLYTTPANLPVEYETGIAYQAIWHGRRDILEFYAESVGIDYIRGETEFSWVSRAACNNQFEMFKFLLSKMPDPLSCLKAGDHDIFVTAASNNSIDIMKYCIELCGAKECVQAANYDAFRSAVTGDHINILKYLISVGDGTDYKTWMENEDMSELTEDCAPDTICYLIGTGIINIADQDLMHNILANIVLYREDTKAMRYIFDIWFKSWPQDSVCDLIYKITRGGINHSMRPLPFKELLKIECIYHKASDTASAFLDIIQTTPKKYLPETLEPIRRLHKRLLQAPASAINKPLVNLLRRFDMRAAHMVYRYVHYPLIFSDWGLFDKVLADELVK